MTLREKIQPFFMYGTAWKDDKTQKLTELALESGFRAIDTANQRKHYFEAGVGKAISNFIDQTDHQRGDLFLQTKFTYQEGQDHRLPYDPDSSYTDQVNQSFQSSLDHLNTDYIDSYVLHGPSTRRGLNSKDYEVWQAMEDLQEKDVVLHLGASNISADQLQLLIDHEDTVPSFVQNRCFAQRGWDMRVRKLCEQHDIIYQGFSLLTANQRFITHPSIRKIADKYNQTIPQLIFTFAHQLGMLPLTGTTDEKHMKQDIAAIDYELTDQEMTTIENIAL